ncbi:MobF family relaxase [Rubinisphaera brasiliensis]|uniref:TrwC relaxase n=1 Tax=Rubinisphaera brasiliensis (strain ATCC 49424 / DSM 5305 / JCM 21570 / IAM 15109 / NBRC 103401 / IFAM 1448) TaxID=756272 RepID=F0SS17_RUBBR|nr:MobF family relaxase [Rubinisphaera brasiliensis]ADY61355.1 TrwC relaxase [Rubinisphaera brasiliensis DSM 5305]
MLSVAKLGGNLNYYLELATLEYYQRGGEPVGRWFGTGAERLKLVGEIDPDVIQRIAAGFSADGSKKLVQNAGKENRQIGWDLTFSAPKSVSVLWSVANETDRAEIQAAQDEAVRVTIGYLEEKCGASRVGKRGREQTEAGLVVGLFEHGSSRANALPR